VRVLRDPAEIGASVDHAHLDLEDDARPAGRGCVLHRDVTVKGRRHEGGVHAAAGAVLVRLPEVVREHAARQAAVHLVHPRKLARLDDHAVDHVDGGDVCVALAAREILQVGEELGVLLPGSAEVVVVLGVHRPRVQPGGKRLLQQQRVRVRGGELRVLLPEHRPESLRRKGGAGGGWRRGGLPLGGPPALLLGLYHKPPLRARRGRDLVVGGGEWLVRVGGARVLPLHGVQHVRIRRADLLLEASEEGGQLTELERESGALQELVVQGGCSHGLHLAEVPHFGVQYARELLAHAGQPLLELSD